MAREWASTARRFSRSRTVWTARAPATRVIGSMFQSRRRAGALLAADEALGLGHRHGVGIGDPSLQLGLPARVEFNWQVLETHGGRFSLGGLGTSARSYKRYFGLRNYWRSWTRRVGGAYQLCPASNRLRPRPSWVSP